ncbi:MAG: glycosyltransferase [Acidovorax sp.]|uniref:glycosyltransferase n=1 Tax=Acidovorax sp. TaxID=1872122 RepID=UPI0025C62D20|nr:glycosyltransferase [Acidovorax sp.]MCE1191515.1 glycosyltransferase [Acidovorax sp.]
MNHTSARNFEVPMLKRVGVSQIFLPKRYPTDPSFRSANVDYSEDENLQISAADLQILNDANWYGGADPEAWEVANKNFDLLFFILHQPDVLSQAARYFKGAILWRAYGLDSSQSYGSLARYFKQRGNIEKVGSRFYFGEAYPHLADSEPSYLQTRRVYLPLGIANSVVKDIWRGEKRQIYFVCPSIGFNDYYKKIYQDFCDAFGDLDCVIAGSQPVYVSDPRILGYVTNEQHVENMTQSRVMFYQSQEPNHIHYHPFEAIRTGMPLVFMEGGMLDRLGGEKLPGRCSTIKEARKKIERILGGDDEFTEHVRKTQVVLLESMRTENCEAAWRIGLERIASEVEIRRAEKSLRPMLKKKKKVAVILPVEYRGGSLRGALALAKALLLGSRKWGEEAEIIFAHINADSAYTEDDFQGLHPDISRRSFAWKIISPAEARRAMLYAGHKDWEPASDAYMVPDDNIQQMTDCDLWVFVSDRIRHALLPIRPYVLMVYDYIQRYQDVVSGDANMAFINAARGAEKILVTTDFTGQDALQYAGIEKSKIAHVPMLPPEIKTELLETVAAPSAQEYFVWTTNAAPHKNHRNAAEALRIYYEELGGELGCMVTGVNTEDILNGSYEHHKAISSIFERSAALRKHVSWLGEISDQKYCDLLTRAKFLWHAGLIDNGTFSVIEAASLGVPALSSDYPAMREIDAKYALELTWMDPNSSRNMALQLKYMEGNVKDLRGRLPSKEQLALHSVENMSYSYWSEVRACM